MSFVSLVALLATLFVISFVSNATPFFGASYTLLATGVLISRGFTLDNFAEVVFVTALGASLAKLVLYSGSFGFRNQLNKNKNVRLFHGWLNKRSYLVALFLAAFIPVLPLDDYIYIGAGANRAPIAPMFIVTFLAKLAKSAVEIFLEFNGILVSTSIFGVSSIELTIAFSIFFLVLGIIIYKLDWEKLLWKTGVIKSRPSV